MVRRKANRSELLGKAGVVVLILSLSLSLGARWGKKSKLNQIEEVKLETVEGVRQVLIKTTQPATYSVYRPLEPIRIIVDISDAKVAKGVPSQIEVNDGMINLIKISTSKGERTSIARVEIGLDKLMAYELNRKDENTLVVKIMPSPEEQGEKKQDLIATSEGKLVVEKSEEGPAEAEAEPVEAEAIEEEATAPAPAPSTTVAEVPQKLAEKLLDIVVMEEEDRTSVMLVMDGRAPDYNAFQLKNPPRLVLDLWRIKNLYPGQRIKINSQGIKQVRLGQHPDKLRLVFDGVGASLPSYRIEKKEDRLVLLFSTEVELVGPPAPPLAVPISEIPPTPEETAPAPELPEEALPPVAPPPEVTPELPRIIGVDFKYTQPASKIIIKASEPVKYEKYENPEDLIFSVVIKGAKLAPELERSLDTTEFQSPVNLVSSFQATEQDVNIVINLNRWLEPEIKAEGNQLEISFPNPSAQIVPPAEEMPAPQETGEEISAPSQAPAPGIAPPSPVPAPAQPVQVETITGVKVYTGAPITIEAKNLDILDALRAIAEVSGLNIITSDKVKGNITLKLENVPWDQALDLILETKGLGMIKYGNIVRIAPIKDIQAEQEQKMKTIQQKQQLQPIQTRIIPVNYAKADQIAKQLKSILSERGSVQVDKRTNSLILMDIPSKIQEAQVMISALDTRTPQVLIEARIVEATVGVTRELGIQWGFNYNAGPPWGNPTGVNFPNYVQVGGAVLGGQINPIDPNILNTVGAQGGAMGITFGSLTNALSLDLLLKSLETQNKIKIISSPRILTMDNEKAVIQQGVTIPYPPALNLATGAAGGAQWQFVEAALRLEVTPHVSPDGTIVLEIKASNNEPNLKVVSGGAPSIDKKEAQTQIIAKDGETIVIGGIYKTKESETTNQVPFLAKIPILGKLFQDKFIENSRNELLIFLTPRIVK